MRDIDAVLTLIDKREDVLHARLRKDRSLYTNMEVERMKARVVELRFLRYDIKKLMGDKL